MNTYSRIIYILLAFYFGMLGFHHAFVGDKSMFKKMFFGTILGIVTAPLVIGCFVLLVIAILAIVDCYKACVMTDDDFFDLYHK